MCSNRNVVEDSWEGLPDAQHRAMLLTSLIRLLDREAERDIYDDEVVLAFRLLQAVASKEVHSIDDDISDCSSFDWVASFIAAAYPEPTSAFSQGGLAGGIHDILRTLHQRKTDQ